MIIDSHVHIGVFGRYDMKPEYVIDSMERYGIDYSLLSPITGVEFGQEHTPLPDDWPYDQQTANIEAIAFARENDGKIGILPWCRPNAEGFTDEFARLIDESGRYIKGLKFHPYHSMLPVTAPQIEPYLSLTSFLSHGLSMKWQRLTQASISSWYIWDLSPTTMRPLS